MRRFPSTAFLSTVLAANICSIFYVISSIEDVDHGKSVGDSASIEVKNILEVETDLEDKEEKEALEDEDKENLMKDFQIGGKVDLGLSNELPSGIELVFGNSELHTLPIIQRIVLWVGGLNPASIYQTNIAFILTSKYFEKLTFLVTFAILNHVNEWVGKKHEK